MMKSFEKKIQETLMDQSLVRHGDHLLVGLSGGPDSLSLIHVLNKMKKEWQWTLYAVHVNHQLRGAAAEEDQCFVKSYCEKNGIHLWSEKKDCRSFAEEEKLTLEESGRVLRYQIYDQEAQALETQGIPKEKIKIVLGQNKKDQAETLLFRLIRGTGLRGLTGIPSHRKSEKGYEIVRPLLNLTRKEIQAYCEKEGLEPRWDQSNENPQFTRNKIRGALIPFLEQHFNPGIEEALIRLRENVIADQSYLDLRAKEIFEETVEERHPHRIVCNRKKLKQQHEAMMGRVIFLAMEAIGLDQEISRNHIETTEELIVSGSPSATYNFPKGYRFYNGYEQVIFAKQSVQEREETEERYLKKAILDRQQYKEALEKEKNPCAYFDLQALEEAFDGGDIPSLIEMRSRCAGDYLPMGHGRKKVKKLLIDMKIPAEKRGQVLLMAIGNEVLWLWQPVGQNRFSSKYPVTSETGKVLKLELARKLC